VARLTTSKIGVLVYFTVLMPLIQVLIPYFFLEPRVYFRIELSELSACNLFKLSVLYVLRDCNLQFLHCNKFNRCSLAS
jgi:hypothetical protein